MHWSDFEPALHQHARKDHSQDKIKPKILGTDISDLAIKECRMNLKSAGIEQDVQVSTHDFFNDPPPVKNGHILLNPPYDARIELEDSVQYYKRIGDVLKQKYKGSCAWIFSGNQEAIKHVGLKPARKFTLFNGPIESKFHKFEIY